MPGGFGLKPFGFGPFGVPSTPPSVQPPTILVSSRAIDGVEQLYQLDAYGNPLGMDDVLCRVYILVSFASVKSPIITPPAMSAQAAAIRTALAPLWSGPTPAITNLVVSVTSPNPGNMLSQITYTNALTGTQTSVTLT